MDKTNGQETAAGTEVGFTAKGAGGLCMALKIGDLTLFDGKIGPSGAYSDFLSPGGMNVATARNFAAVA
jgi:hypothetical protein